MLGERKLWKWCLCSANQCEQVQGRFKMKKIKDFINVILDFLLKGLRGCKISWR